MRDYGKVAPTFWLRGSGKLLRGHPLAQVLALYLFTAPGASMTGLFYLALPSVCHETGLDEEELAEALDKIEELGIALYDDEAELIWVPEMARYQIGEELRGGDKRIRGVEREIGVHEGHPFHALFVAKYKEAFSLTVDADEPEPWPARHRKPLPSPFQAPSKPLPSQELTVPVPVPVSGSGSGSTLDPSKLLPKEDPETAGARVALSVPAVALGVGQAPLLAAGPAKSPRLARSKPPKAPKDPAEVRYGRAFADGQVDAGAERFTPPTDSSARHAFRTSLPVHAKGADGKPLRGEALDAWIRAKSAAYRRARPNDGDYGDGFTPRKMFAWLGGGARASPAYRQQSPAVQQPAAPGESTWTGPTIIEA